MKNATCIPIATIICSFLANRMRRTVTTSIIITETSTGIQLTKYAEVTLMEAVILLDIHSFIANMAQGLL
jgi:hypothetical protein